MRDLTEFQTNTLRSVEAVLSDREIAYASTRVEGNTEHYVTVDFWGGVRVWIYTESAEITRERIMKRFEKHRGVTTDELRAALTTSLEEVVNVRGEAH